MGPEGPVGRGVSGGVGGDLGTPVMRPAVWHSAVPVAAMPEATVHKHGEALLGEDEVWLPWQWTVPAPAADSMSAKDRRQFQFRAFVAL